MAWQHRRPTSAMFLIGSCISVLCCSPITASGASGGKVSEPVQTCSEVGGTLRLELSRKTPEVKFKCGNEFISVKPPTTVEKSPSCFTDKECKVEGSLPKLFNGEAYLQPLGEEYLVKTTGFPETDTTVYFLCTDSAAVSAEKKCTVEVTVKGSAPVAEDRQCKTAGGTVNIHVTPSAKDATFTCGGDMTTLAPASAEDVFTGQDCSASAKLATVIPKATFTRGVELEAHTLSISTFPEKTTTLCYKCQKSGANDECKVIITVDSASATTTTTASTSGAASVMAEAGGHAILWVAALSTTVLYGR
ncbi:sag-related sequence srs60a [Cystoisospora suis]|uniref:Sag-related sequence srs60a n=1 Tax=Cystoisospora suis TaxID=483139 RepID=A0A2C6KXW0_9APIC|nr:sag-related sequence srs60a [Cystoisospora suis]